MTQQTKPTALDMLLHPVRNGMEAVVHCLAEHQRLLSSEPGHTCQASSAFAASGFSHNMCLPALSARAVRRTCRLFGNAT